MSPVVFMLAHHGRQQTDFARKPLEHMLQPSAPGWIVILLPWNAAAVLTSLTVLERADANLSSVDRIT
jgi:hypothetical protein